MTDVGVVLVVILVIVLVWRGPRNLPRLGEALGRGVRGARDEARAVRADVERRHAAGADEQAGATAPPVGTDAQAGAPGAPAGAAEGPAGAERPVVGAPGARAGTTPDDPGAPTR